MRSETSLMQTIGRSARNVNAKVILYADRVTESMQKAIDETNRRRTIQKAYNKKNGITPETIRKNIHRGIESEADAHVKANEAVGQKDDELFITQEYINELEKEMLDAADRLEFEKAAALRDRIEEMRDYIGKKTAVFEFDRKQNQKKNPRRGRKRPSAPFAKRVPKPEKG